MAHRSLLLLILIACFTQVPAPRLDIKIDCRVTEWSVWGPTDSNGYRTRTREVWREPSDGGQPCPPLTQTDSDPWFPRTVPVLAAQLKEFCGPTIKPRDFLFIVDRSGSISSSHYVLVKKSLAMLVGQICGSIGLGIGNNRAAVITFSTNAEINFDFDDYTNLADVQDAILNLPKDSGVTCTGDALNLAQTIFTAARGARPDHQSVKEVVLLTDGGSNCGPDAVTAAINLRNSRTPELALFVFAVDDFGPDDQLEMENMATPNAGVLSDHLYHFIDQLEFQDVVKHIEDNFPDPCAPITVGK